MDVQTISLFTARVERAYDWVALHRARLKRIALASALTIFIVGLVLSFQTRPDILEQASLFPLLGLVLITLPFGLVLNALDFQVMARMCGARVGFWDAFKIGVYSSAANMLPIPGSMAVRVGVLKSHGVTLRRGSGLAIMFTVIFGGMGFLYSAVWLAIQSYNLLALSFAAVSALLLAACMVYARHFRLPWGLVSATSLIRLGLVATDALNLLLALSAIGISAKYQQTAILVVAGFLASFVPAGIGIRESVVAALAPIAAIDPASGFLAATIARVCSMAFLAMCAGIAYLTTYRAMTARSGR